MSPTCRKLAGVMMALFVGPLLAACPSPEASVVGPPAPQAGVQLRVGVVELAVSTSRPASARLQLIRSGPAESVALSASAPPGLSAAVMPATLPANQAEAIVDLALVSPLPAGRYAVVIRARSAGGAQDSVAVAVDVAAPPLPGLTLQVVPSPISITAGGAAPVMVRVTRPQNLTGAVSFAATSNPAGATVTTFPANEPGAITEQQLLVRVPASTSPGAFTVPLSATLAGTSGATLPLTVDVVAPAAREVAIRRCDPDNAPIWAAVSDGLFGSPQRLTPDAAGMLRFTLTQPAAAVTLVERDEDTADDLRVTTLAATVDEWVAFAADACLGRKTSRDQPITVRNVWRDAVVSGPFWSVQGVPNGVVEIGQQVTGALSTSLRVPMTGRYTIVAGRTQSLVNGGPFDRMIIKRDIDAAQSTPITLDFLASEAFQPSVRSVTTTGVAGVVTATSHLLTADGTPHKLTPNSTTRTSTGLAVMSVPMARREAGDLMGFAAVHRSSFRSSQFFRDYVMEQLSESVLAEDRDASIGFTTPRFRNIWLSNVPGNYARIVFDGETDAVGVREYAFRMVQQRGLLGARMSEFRITTNALAAFRVPSGVSRFRLETPAFSGLPGWRDTFMPQYLTSTGVEIEEAGWTGGTVPFLRRRIAGFQGQVSIVDMGPFTVQAPASRLIVTAR